MSTQFLIIYKFTSLFQILEELGLDLNFKIMFVDSEKSLKEKVKNSIKIDELEIDNYDLVFIAGGWGAAYDLGYSEILGKKISQAYYNPNSIIGGVCHGVLGFINAKDSIGNLIIKNRRMTGVTDKQIKELGIDFTPQHPEEELIKAGAIFESKTAIRRCICQFNCCG